MRQQLIRATALHQSGNLQEAGRLYRQILSADPNNANALTNLGSLLLQFGEIDESIDLLARSLKIYPTQASTLNSLAIAYRKIGKTLEAIDACERALKLKPDYAECWNTRGNILRVLNHKDGAIASYLRAISLRSDYAEAYHNCANVLHELGKLDESLANYDRALAIRPNYAETFAGRGNPLRDLGRFDEALADYDRALKIDPDAPEANFNKALLLLLLGDYDIGWKLFEARWRREESRSSIRNFVMPLWLGYEDIQGKILFLHAEQGFGDTIQFCRYAALACKRGASIIIEVPPPLVGLIRTLDIDIDVVAAGAPPPVADFHCPLMSLPLAFGTSLDEVPMPSPYLLARDEWLVSWSSRLGPKNRPRIGLAWSGNPMHRNDHNRSISLATLLPLLEVDAEFHCLQKGISDGDLELLAALPQICVWEDRLMDFSDAAAATSLMDLVICVDTSLAHLAGALGIPTWVLLPRIPDYRWLLDRTDSPWYRGLRLYRQTTSGDWRDPIASVVADLDHFLASSR